MPRCLSTRKNPCRGSSYGAAMLSACGPDQPPVQAPRPVRTFELRYDHARQANLYAGTVQSRHEVDQAFRVGGKVAQRKVDVGQFVHEGDVLAVLDDADYRLAEEAARQQHAAAVTQARQADSDRQRLGDLLAEFAERQSSVHNGSFWFIPHDRAEALADLRRGVPGGGQKPRDV